MDKLSDLLRKTDSLFTGFIIGDIKLQISSGDLIWNIKNRIDSYQEGDEEYINSIDGIKMIESTKYNFADEVIECAGCKVTVANNAVTIDGDWKHLCELHNYYNNVNI